MIAPYTQSSLSHKFKCAMAKIGYNIPDLYAMERGGWSNTSTLKGIYQQTFDSERQAVDNKIDDYFSEIYDIKYDTKNNKQRETVG